MPDLLDAGRLAVIAGYRPTHLTVEAVRPRLRSVMAILWGCRRGRQPPQGGTHPAASYCVGYNSNSMHPRRDRLTGAVSVIVDL